MFLDGKINGVNKDGGLIQEFFKRTFFESFDIKINELFSSASSQWSIRDFLLDNNICHSCNGMIAPETTWRADDHNALLFIHGSNVPQRSSGQSGFVSDGGINQNFG